MTTQHTHAIDHFRKNKGLGRIQATDARDMSHLMAAVIPRQIMIDHKTWNGGAVLDQGSTSQCVGYAWTGFLLAAPIMDKLGKLPEAYATSIYRRAQECDEWPGIDYEGTSVRAGAKVLKNTDQRLVEYLWAHDANTVKNFILTRGPVVIGINWYETMFAPTDKGFLIVDGGLAGGHAILVIGYSKVLNAFRLVQSWGRSWGENGRAWLKFDDMERLIHEDGEACSAIECKPPMSSTP